MDENNLVYILFYSKIYKRLLFLFISKKFPTYPDNKEK